MFKHRFPWQAQWILHLAKSEANVCVLQQFQKRWLKRVCKDASRMAGAVQEISPSSDMLRGQGADLLRRDGFWSIRFSGYFREMARKNAKRIRTRPSALHSAFHFWRRSHRIAPFLTLPSSTLEEVSEKCFVLEEVWQKSFLQTDRQDRQTDQ